MGNQQSFGSKYSDTDLTSSLNSQFLSELINREPDFIVTQKDNKYKFFWLANEDPDKIKDFQTECIWSPYDREDCLFLEYWYQRFLKGDMTSPRIGDYIIDFCGWIQYHYIDKWRRRAILRTEPSKVSRIYRKSRFDKNFSFSNYNETIIDSIKETKKTGKIADLNINFNYFNISNKYKPIEFCIISNSQVKFSIQNYFYKYLNTIDLSASFKDYLNNLKLEINKISKELNRFNFYNIDYLNDITERTFFHSIIKMYTEEGFLYKLVNKVLREKDTKLLAQIKFYFSSLLAGFHFFSEHSMDLEKYKENIPEETQNQIKENKRFYVYRGTYLTPEELNATSKSIEKNFCIIRIYNEFISTSLKKNIAEGFAHSSGNCLLELEINYEESKGSFAYLNPEITKFSSEAEVLLRSGSIIKITKLQTQRHPMNTNENFFFIYGSLISLSLDKLILSNLNQRELNLSWNTIDIENMKLLSDALKSSTSLECLSLEGNKLGFNIENMKLLTDSLKYNNSIQELILGSNKIGHNIENVILIADIIKTKASLKLLDLSNNYLGMDDIMRIISDSIKYNSFLKVLNLSENQLGNNLEGIMHLSEALKCNFSLKELNLSSNGLGNKPNAMKLLTNVFYSASSCSVLECLNLGSNNIESDSEAMKQLTDALKSNNSIKSLSLFGNDIGSDFEGMRLISSLLESNSTIQELDLSYNNIGWNIIGNHTDGMRYLAAALKCNKSLQKLNLSNNIIGCSTEFIKLFADAIKYNIYLKWVELSRNKINSNREGIKLLTDALKSNKGGRQFVFFGYDDCRIQSI